MLIKSAKYKKVKRIVNERISQEVYGCDECKGVIDLNKPKMHYLEFTIFKNKGNSERHIICSWKCFAENIKKVKTDYFVSLPFLNFDINQKGLRSRDFIEILKEQNER